MVGAEVATWLIDLIHLEVREPSGSFWVDLANLDWWSKAIILVGTLGLSPAPWLAGLAAGRLQFSGVARKDFERQLAEQAKGYERQLSDQDAAHAREIQALTDQSAALMDIHRERYAESEAARKLNAKAAEVERERADQATGKLVDIIPVVRSVQHFMESQFEAAREVVEDGT